MSLAGCNPFSTSSSHPILPRFWSLGSSPKGAQARLRLGGRLAMGGILESPLFTSERLKDAKRIFILPWMSWIWHRFWLIPNVHDSRGDFGGFYVASESPGGPWMGEHDQDRVFEGTEEFQTLAARESRYGDGSKPWYLVNPKIAGKWMFIPLKMVFIGIDP